MSDIEAQKISQDRFRILALCSVTALAILISDLLLPLGVAEAVPYVAVVLISLRSPNKKDPLLAAVGCSLLTLLGFELSGEGAEIWMAAVNRGIAIFAIWVTAILAMQIKDTDITARTQSQMLMGILGNTPTVAFTVDQEGYLRESQGKGLHRLGISEKPRWEEILLSRQKTSRLKPKNLSPEKPCFMKVGGLIMVPHGGFSIMSRRTPLMGKGLLASASILRNKNLPSVGWQPMMP